MPYSCPLLCCRPTDFLPVEYAGIKGIEQRMYKEQEKLKLRSHAEIMEAYVKHCSQLPLFDVVLFPARVSQIHLVAVFENT